MSVLYSIFIILSLLAALTDFLFYKIPNIFVLGMIILAIPLLVFMLPLNQVYMTLMISAAMLAIGFGFSLLGWIGAGDAKLLTASTLWVAHIGMVDFILIMALSGAVLALIYLGFSFHIDRVRMKIIALLKEKPLSKIPLLKGYAAEPFIPAVGISYMQTKIPYGIAIAAASIIISLSHMGVRL